MKSTAKKDAAKIIILMLIICIVFKFVLLPLYVEHPEKEKELPAQTEQLNVQTDTK